MTAAHLPRRHAGLIAAVTLGLGGTHATRAAAQGASAVAAPPPPCATLPGEVVGLVLTGTGAPEGSTVVFGQAFRPGDVPSGVTLVARRHGGAPVALQVDVTTRHADGSARFAILALAAPALRRGQSEGIVLSRASATPPQPQDPAGLGGVGELVLEIAPPEGRPWRADLAAMAQAHPSRGRRPWQAGPLARQVRVETLVPPSAVGGAASVRLVADLARRRDGSLWADIWLRNDVAMRPAGGTATYSAQLLHQGREVLRLAGIRQPHYTALGRSVHLAPDGRPAAPPPMVTPDVAYLAETGAVARYDVGNGVEEALLARFAAGMAAPAWHVPFAPRGFTQYMPTTGGRFDIGPATGWQAAWLISGDARAAAFATGQAEAAGGIPWHFWDPGGGADGQGGWLDTRRWPGLWTDPRGGAPPRTLPQPIPTDTGWSPDDAHQPDVAFVPYLLTGRRAFLDEVLAQGARSVVSTYPAGRKPSPRAGDVIVANGGQVRGSAWNLRQVDEAAWIVPDDDPNASFLRAAATDNWSWLRAQTPAWTARQGEAHGWLPGAYRDPGATAPWQQDYLASIAAAAAARGNRDAQAFLSWMANFLTGRFLNARSGFVPADGIAYRLAVAPAAPAGEAYTTWRRIGDETRARGWSGGGDWSRVDAHYAQLAIASLAALNDLVGDTASREALALVLAARPRGTAPVAYRRTPTHAVVTRGTTRAAGRVHACVARARAG